MSKIIDNKPSNNIFFELEKNQVSFEHLLSEFVDNSIGSMVDNKCSVVIEIRGNWNNKNKQLDREDAQLIITDNASGITFDNLALALSPAACSGLRKNSLHEHGLGMKTAICSLGTSVKRDSNNTIVNFVDFEIITKTSQDSLAHRISEMHFGQISVDEINADHIFQEGHGTQIVVKSLKDKVRVRKEDYSTYLIPFLAHRYQFFLSATYGKKLTLTVKLTDENGNAITDKRGQICEYVVTPIHVVWQGGQPVVDRALPHGKVGSKKKWSAHMRFGWSPSSEELMAYPLHDQARSHGYIKSPYYIHNMKIDLIMNEIAIVQVDYSWITLKADVTIGRDWRSQRPRLQVFLYSNFETTSSKDGVQESDFLEELKENIWEEIRKYANTDKSRIFENEKELKDKLEKTLRDSFLDVKREPTVADYGLRSDFSLTRKGNPEIWEVKVIQAGAPEFMQLVGYLLTTGTKHGVLVAREFNDNARSLAQDCQRLFGCTIELKELSIYNL
jgi:septum formation topological specificity factor MinE